MTNCFLQIKIIEKIYVCLFFLLLLSRFTLNTISVGGEGGREFLFSKLMQIYVVYKQYSRNNF